MEAASLPVIPLPGIQSDPPEGALPAGVIHSINRAVDPAGAIFSELLDQYSSVDNSTEDIQVPVLPDNTPPPLPVARISGSLLAETGIDQWRMVNPSENKKAESDTVTNDQTAINIEQEAKLLPLIQQRSFSQEPVKPALPEKTIQIAPATYLKSQQHSYGEPPSFISTERVSPVITETTPVREPQESTTPLQIKQVPEPGQNADRVYSWQQQNNPQPKKTVDLRSDEGQLIFPKLQEPTASNQPVIAPITDSTISSESVKIPDSLSAVPTIKTPSPNMLPQEVPVNRLGSKLIQMISKGESAIEIRLDPPELGKLTLTLTVENDALSLQVNATSSAAKDLIMAQGDRLRQALAEQDLSLADLSVNVQSESSDRQGSKKPGDQSPVETSLETIALADLGEDTQNFMPGDLLYRIQGGRLLDHFI